jgi:hypothetical protein
VINGSLLFRLLFVLPVLFYPFFSSTKALIPKMDFQLAFKFITKVISIIKIRCYYIARDLRRFSTKASSSHCRHVVILETHHSHFKPFKIFYCNLRLAWRKGGGW